MLNSEMVSCNAIIPHRKPLFKASGEFKSFEISSYMQIVNIDEYKNGLTHDEWYEFFPKERLEPFRFSNV